MGRKELKPSQETHLLGRFQGPAPLKELPLGLGGLCSRLRGSRLGLGLPGPGLGQLSTSLGQVGSTAGLGVSGLGHARLSRLGARLRVGGGVARCAGLGFRRRGCRYGRHRACLSGCGGVLRLGKHSLQNTVAAGEHTR